jgi:hypothetical protein
MPSRSLLVALATAAALTVALAPSAASAVQPQASDSATAGSPPTVSDAVDIALNHVRTNAESLGLMPGDVDELLVTDAYQEPTTASRTSTYDRR